jgi:thymidylate synthase
LLTANAQTFVDVQPINAALDVKQRVDALDRLQRDRRDRRCVLSAPSVSRNVSQFEKLPPCMGLIKSS